MKNALLVIYILIWTLTMLLYAIGTNINQDDLIGITMLLMVLGIVTAESNI